MNMKYLTAVCITFEMITDHLAMSPIGMRDAPPSIAWCDPDALCTRLIRNTNNHTSVEIELRYRSSMTVGFADKTEAIPQPPYHGRSLFNRQGEIMNYYNNPLNSEWWSYTWSEWTGHLQRKFCCIRERQNLPRSQRVAVQVSIASVCLTRLSNESCNSADRIQLVRWRSQILP